METCEGEQALTKTPSLSVVALLAFVATTLAAAAPPPQPVGESPHVSSNSATRELTELRTRNSRTYVAPDGGRIARIWPSPVNFGGSGHWQGISNRLVQSALPGYALRNEANDYRADLPANLTSPARFAVGESWARFTMIGAAATPGVSTGPRVDYVNVAPGVNVTYVAAANGLKEFVTLLGRDAPRTFRYRLEHSDDLEPRPEPEPDGSIVLAGQGDASVRIEAPFMYDAAGVSDDRGSVSLVLRRDSRGLVLEATANDGWLDAPERMYPVTIDPTVTWTSQRSAYIEQPLDTYITAAYPTENRWGWPYIRAGIYDGAQYRSLLRFDVNAALPPNSTVLSSLLSVYTEATYDASPVSLTPHRVTAGWTEQATWNTRDGTSPWTSPGGDFSGSASGKAVSFSAGSWSTFRDLQGVTQDWIYGTYPDYGLLLKSATLISGKAQFTAADGSSATWPVLEIYYLEPTGAHRHWTFMSPKRDGSETISTMADPSRLADVNVNVASGALLLHARDAAGPIEDDDLHLDRFYNSWNRDTMSFGRGWSEGEGKEVWLAREPDDSLAFFAPGRGVVRFTANADGSFASPPTFTGRLIKNADGSYTVRDDTTRGSYEFILGSSMRAYIDPEGKRTAYAYDGGADDYAMRTRTDESGVVASYTNVPGSRRIARIDEGGNTYQYSYDNVTGDLVSATSPGGKIVRYTWDASSRLTMVEAADGTRTKFTYDTFWGGRRLATLTRVTDNTAGTGPTWRFSYAAGLTRITGPTGKVTNYYYNGDLSLARSQSGASPPGSTLSGSLYSQRSTTTSADSLDLTVAATDTAEGVKTIEVTVDGERVHLFEQPCVSGGCAASRSITLWTQDFGVGPHVVEATASDQAGAAVTRQFFVGFDQLEGAEAAAADADFAGAESADPDDPGPPYNDVDSDPTAALAGPAPDGTIPLGGVVGGHARTFDDALQCDPAVGYGYGIPEYLDGPAGTSRTAPDSPGAAVVEFLHLRGVPRVATSRFKLTHRGRRSAAYEIHEGETTVGLLTLAKVRQDWRVTAIALCNDVGD